MAIHPILTTQKIRDSYLDYLKTIKPFQDEDLRKEFAKAIEERDMLVKGPLVQIALPYKKDLSIEQLVAEGVLSPKFKQLCSEALAYDRSLYAHQVKAIRKSGDRAKPGCQHRYGFRKDRSLPDSDFKLSPA
jgi:ATP-dependent helicase YprA (DUF1998 family)